jgi:hypothetical protein
MRSRRGATLECTSAGVTRYGHRRIGAATVLDAR